MLAIMTELLSGFAAASMSLKWKKPHLIILSFRPYVSMAIKIVLYAFVFL